MNSIAINDYVPQVEPSRWPFPPSRPAPRRPQPVQPAPRDARPVSASPGRRGTVRSASAQSALRRDGAFFQGATRRQIVTDVILVAAWGIMIPGGLWLGHWLGF